MQTLLEMSISGAVMIGVIIIVRALAVNRLPKTAFLALWGAAFFCLILPVRIPSPVSVYTAVACFFRRMRRRPLQRRLCHPGCCFGQGALPCWHLLFWSCICGGAGYMPPPCLWNTPLPKNG